MFLGFQMPHILSDQIWHGNIRLGQACFYGYATCASYPTRWVLVPKNYCTFYMHVQSIENSNQIFHDDQTITCPGENFCEMHADTQSVHGS